MTQERPKQSKELMKAVSDREKRVERLVSFLALALSEGRKSLGAEFEARLQETLESNRGKYPDPLIVQAGLLDLREALLTSIFSGAYDPLARKLLSSLKQNDKEAELRERWFKEAIVTSGDSTADQMDWLIAQTPDIWHIVIDGWNFDYALDWKWFAQHPDLDAGTAANIFIPCATSHLSGEFEDEMFTALKIIAQRWNENGFKTSLYNISKEFSDNDNWRDEYYRAYDELVRSGKTPSFPRLDSLWSYKGELEPITPYQQEHSIILQRYDLWLDTVKDS